MDNHDQRVRPETLQRSKSRALRECGSTILTSRVVFSRSPRTPDSYHGRLGLRRRADGPKGSPGPGLAPVDPTRAARLQEGPAFGLGRAVPRPSQPTRCPRGRLASRAGLVSRAVARPQTGSAAGPAGQSRRLRAASARGTPPGGRGCAAAPIAVAEAAP
eukprot:scaffold3365_cov66-Phaeocystis_antarctica.AAC.4